MAASVALSAPGAVGRGRGRHRRCALGPEVAPQSPLAARAEGNVVVAVRGTRGHLFDQGIKADVTDKARWPRRFGGDEPRHRPTPKGGRVKPKCNPGLDAGSGNNCCEVHQCDIGRNSETDRGAYCAVASV